MIRYPLVALIPLLLIGCDRADFRNGHLPGEVERTENANVYHLADGVLIQEQKNGSNVYYLIESTVSDYELTADGLDIVLEGENAGTYSTTPAPPGFVAAWITEVPGDGLGLTRFRVEAATLESMLQEFTAETTIQDVSKLRQ